MTIIRTSILCMGLLTTLTHCGDDRGLDPTPVEDDRALSGGAATVFDASSLAFENPIPSLDGMDLDRFLAGDAAFEQVFVTSPAAVGHGLGPVFNQTSCVGCHARDGRGREGFGEVSPFIGSMLMRVSLPGTNPAVPGGPQPVPGFGEQIGDRAVFGVAPEARIDVTYFEETRHFADGTAYSLRFPVYDVVDTYQPLPADVLFSPRMAPPVFGRGLLEAIPEETILALADPGDSDGDGISGRPNRVYNFRTQQTELGRFGLKANNPDLLQQIAGAYQQDMGITNPYFPEESTVGQPQMDDHRDDPEIGQETLDINTFYVQTLAVPARRNLDDPQALRGEELFAAAQCSGCHIPTLQTGHHEIAALANQTIHPYTDLLLHDMGEELADDRPDFEADGREWRTPPLWGIGLTATVNGIPAYLHDGRARTLMEAIMFHGGEAETAREFVRQLDQSDRDALVAFLQSL